MISKLSGRGLALVFEMTSVTELTSLTVTHPLLETPTTPCNIEKRAPRGRPSAAKVSQLHLYLPSSSSLCEDEDEEAETEEMRYGLSLCGDGVFKGGVTAVSHWRTDICITLMNCSSDDFFHVTSVVF